MTHKLCGSILAVWQLLSVLALGLRTFVKRSGSDSLALVLHSAAPRLRKRALVSPALALPHTLQAHVPC